MSFVSLNAGQRVSRGTGPPSYLVKFLKGDERLDDLLLCLCDLPVGDFNFNRARETARSAGAESVCIGLKGIAGSVGLERNKTVAHAHLFDNGVVRRFHAKYGKVVKALPVYISNFGVETRGVETAVEIVFDCRGVPACVPQTSWV